MSEGAEKSTLDKWLARKKESKRDRIVKKPENEPSVLSHGQERLWLLEQLYANQSLYTYGHLYTITGQLNIKCLIQAFQYVVQRHEILRSTYHVRSGNIEQEVGEHSEIPITRIYKGEGVHEQIEEFLHVPFDLEKDLPIRICINEISPSSFEVYLLLHHIAGDAWSMNIINREVSENYRALIGNSSSTIEEPIIQYKDYAYWQRNQSIKETDLSYWKSQLGNDTGELNLPGTVNLDTSFKGKWLKRPVSKELIEKIEKLAKDAGVTLYIYWLAVFKLFLAKYSNQSTINVGSPFSNRDKNELENLIGFFNETLVLKSIFEGDPSFLSITEQVNQLVQEAFNHKNVPFETLVNELNPHRSVGENPLFKAMFLYSEEQEKLSLPDLQIEEDSIDLGVSKFDLTLFVRNGAKGTELVFEYMSHYDDDVIESMMNHFVVLLENITENPTGNISELSLLSKSEFRLITQTWNEKICEIPTNENISELISEHSITKPDSTAIVYGNESITYKELELLSNGVASQLLEHRVQPRDFIGIYAERSIDMIIAIVGILKAGAAYLPLDPKYPKERLNQMLHDSESKLILVQPGIVSKLDLKQVTIERIEKRDFERPPIHPSSYAYLIYTSGSTGKPKGVAISHRALIQSTATRYAYYDKKVKSFLLLSSFSFDSSVVGIFWTLCSGATLVIPQDRIEQDIDLLADTILNHQVSHTLMLPSLYQVILNYVEAGKLKSLTTIIVAGEAVSQKIRTLHFDKLPEVQLFNEYGPTEATVWCTAHKITKSEQGKIPIGKPIPNSQAYVLDRHLNPLPSNVVGRLFIGGDNVSDGYLNNPELTAERFIGNPFKNGKLYDTGDLVKWRDNGNLEFIGRNDSQFKIRGHRVEIGEIKEVFLQIQGVEEVEVQIEKTSKNEIWVYLEGERSLEKAKILRKARESLPDHMIPSQILILDTFPKLPNGKVDVEKLPVPEKSNVGIGTEPETEIEKQLAEIWKETLKLDSVCNSDNFFEIGGDSIQSIRVIAKAKKLGMSLEPSAIFRYQTISKLAASLQNDSEASAIVPMKTSGSAPPLFCIHSGGAHIMFYKEFADEMSSDHPIYAVQPQGLEDGQDYHKSISEMASDYIEEIKKIQPDGPYHLLVTCFSNAVGLDMIHQLKSRDESVAVMYVIDSAPAFLTPPSPNGERMPVRRMIGMIRQGNWSGIYKKFRNRMILANRKFKSHRINEVQKDLYDMIDSLNLIYSRYTWNPIEANIVLIRSSEFARLKGKQFHLDHWGKLSKNNLETQTIEGHHKSLFQQPEVKSLAAIISSHKSELQKEI